MKKVIVTVKIENRKESFDVEISSESNAFKMLAVLCKAYNLGSEKKYNIFAIPPNRLLEPDETYEEAGVWDGAILTLKHIK
jgi:hypothetical protein